MVSVTTTTARRRRRKLISRQQLAVMLDVHPVTITKWQDDGMPVAKRGARGRPSLYDPAAVQAWRTAKEQAARSTDVVSLEQERARMARADALLKEQQYARRTGELVPLAGVERRWSLRAEMIKTRARGLPTRAKQRLPHLTQSDIAVLEDLIAELLEGLVDDLVQAADAEDAHP
jgi:phage terminase Nu1 subunit (DNA packaging protein)